MQKHLISVVMPVYNRARFLHEAIESVLAQDYAHYELIIVDDGSTSHEVREVLNAYSKYPKVSVYSKENGGPGSAVNFGAARVKGDYFCRLDSDDQVTANALTVVNRAINEYPGVSYFYSSRCVIDENSERVLNSWLASKEGVHASVPFDRARLFKEYCCNPLLCWKKEDYLAAGGMRENLLWSEDWEFALRMAESFKFQNIEEALYLVRDYASGHLTSDVSVDEKRRIAQQIQYEARQKEIARVRRESPSSELPPRFQKRKKTALFINNVVQMYGGEMSLFELARSLEDYTPIVVLPRKGPLAEQLEREGIQVLYYDFEERCEPFRRSLNACRFLEKTIEDYDVDIVHLNKAFSFLQPARIAAWARNIPLVCHVRGQIQIDNARKYWLSRCDRILFVSEDAKEYLLRDTGSEVLRDLESQTIEVVHDGRELDAYAFSGEKRARLRNKLGIEPHETVISLVGYFDPLKGQDRFVELARTLLEERPDFKFVMAGDLVGKTHEAYREQVLARVIELGLEEKVIITGYLDCRDWLSATDFVVSLSNTEGLPGIVIEAMAAGRVVVANRVGGIPEIVGDKGAGFCTAQNNLTEMKKIILDVMQCEDRKTRIGSAAKKRAHELFGVEQHCQRIKSLFDFVVAEKLCDSLMETKKEVDNRRLPGILAQVESCEKKSMEVVS